MQAPMSEKESVFFKNTHFVEHTSDCSMRDREDVPVHEAPCTCYDLYWVRLGREMMKQEAAEIVEQCAIVDGTMKKLAQAIRELD